MQLAIALYNNTVDNEEELAFRKGDILTVLIENPHGLDGWWLCQHRGKCGLCPGNRLQLLSSSPPSINANDYVQFPSRLSTASTYDVLSSNHDYDNHTHRSDFIVDSSISPVLDYSIESSSRSSGISSTIDLHLSSSSTEFHPSSLKIDNVTYDLQQLQIAFEKLSIHSNLLINYHQLICKPNQYSKLNTFINECRLFLRDYGYLLDRYTYIMIKEHLLNDLEQSMNYPRRIVEISTRILRYLQPMIELRLKQKPHSKKSHPFKDKLSTSLSTTQIYACRPSQSSRPTLPTSKTYHSNIYEASSSDRSPQSLNSLMRCYYRHIREQADLILQRYSSSMKNEQKFSTMIVDGKSLLVASQKLVFVLETLHEHLQQTMQTSLSLLTRQLNETLTFFLQCLKQLTQMNSSANNHYQYIMQFKQQTKLIINLVKRIQLQCTGVV